MSFTAFTLIQQNNLFYIPFFLCAQAHIAAQVYLVKY